MKNALALSALIAAMASLPLTGFAQDTATEPADTETAEAATDAVPVTADTVVARVGDQEITMAHVIIVRQQLPEQYANLEDSVLFPGIVDQLVDQFLLSAEVDEANLPLPLKLQMENERRAILANAEIGRIVDEGISDEDVQAAYDARIADFEAATEYNASHILVETEEEAQAIVADLEGGAEFAALAQEKSTGPSGPNGGELGWFGAGSMVPEFEAEVVSLEVGAVSAPVQTQFGWHVITLNETRETAPPTLEEVRPAVLNQLNQQAVADRIAELREATSAEILIDGIALDAFRDDALLVE